MLFPQVVPSVACSRPAWGAKRLGMFADCCPYCGGVLHAVSAAQRLHHAARLGVGDRVAFLVELAELLVARRLVRTDVLAEVLAERDEALRGTIEILQLARELAVARRPCLIALACAPVLLAVVRKSRSVLLRFALACSTDCALTALGARKVSMTYATGRNITSNKINVFILLLSETRGVNTTCRKMNGEVQ